LYIVSYLLGSFLYQNKPHVQFRNSKKLTQSFKMSELLNEQFFLWPRDLNMSPL
jgi:hypothetical protein